MCIMGPWFSCCRSWGEVLRARSKMEILEGARGGGVQVRSSVGGEEGKGGLVGEGELIRVEGPVVARGEECPCWGVLGKECGE